MVDGEGVVEVVAVVEWREDRDGVVEGRVRGWGGGLG